MAFDALLGLCTAALDGKEESHPFFEQVKASIEARPFTFQERSTRVSLYCILLADEYLETALTEYCQKYLQSIDREFDRVEARHLFFQLSALAGWHKMRRLHELFARSYIFADPVTAFVQGYTDGLMDFLAEQDAETRQYCFELVRELRP